MHQVIELTATHSIMTPVIATCGGREDPALTVRSRVRDGGQPQCRRVMSGQLEAR